MNPEKLPLMLFPPSRSTIEKPPGSEAAAGRMIRDTEASRAPEAEAAIASAPSLRKKWWTRRMRGGRQAYRAAIISKYGPSATGAPSHFESTIQENAASGGGPLEKISSSPLPVSPAISPKKKYVSPWVKLGLSQQANRQDYESKICLPLPLMPEGLKYDFNTQVSAIDANNLFKAQLQSAILFK
jgi:hypothetical protein